MDSPSSRDFRLPDAPAGNGWLPAEDGETYQATLLLAQAPSDDGDDPDAGATDSPPFAVPAPLARESVRIAWEAEADPGPPPADAADLDAAESYARRFALARFARRMIEGDPHAWIEALVSYWGKVPLPFDVPCRVAVEEGPAVRIGLDLPSPAALDHAPRAPKGERNAAYVEACCGVVLTLAADAFRILPAAVDFLYVAASREETDPATGHPRRAILLRLATDRASLTALNLAAVTPSASFEHLGGALRRERGELAPLAYESPPA
jgi:hypothetical protein